MGIRKQREKRLAAALLTACCTLSPLTAMAEETDETGSAAFSLPATVVTATRTEQTLQNTPSTVQVITRDDIELNQYQTLGDALKEAMGITVFNDFQGRSQLSIRGSESRHVLIMVDGRRLGGELSFNSANAYDLERIRMDNVERIEIIRGTAGALYGSDAMDGVINVITKKKAKNEGSLLYEYGAWDGGESANRNMHFYYQGANEAGNFDWSISAGRHEPQPHRVLDKNGKLITDNYYGKETPIALSAAWRTENGNQWKVDYSKLWEETAMDSIFSMSAAMQLPQITQNDNTRTDWSVEYSGKDEQQDWQIRAYRSEYDKDYHSAYLSSTGWKLNSFDVVERTLSVVEGKSSWQAGDNQRLTAGWEWRKDESWGTRIRKPGSDGTPVTYYWENGYDDTKKADEASLEYRAVYLQDEWKAGSKLLVIPSMRYDWSDQFSSEVTPRLGLTYKAQEDLRIKAVVGAGYKTPTVNELYHYFHMFKTTMGTPGQFFAGNPDLKPEHSTDYELSVEKDWDKTTTRVSVFRNNVKDLIESYNTGLQAKDFYSDITDTSWLMTYHNVDKAVLQGVEGEVSHKLSDALKLRLGYMYLDARDDTTGSRLEERPRHQINTGLTYRPSQSKWSLNMDAVTMKDYLTKEEPKAMANPTVVNQSYTMVNFMAQNQMSNNFMLYLGVDNLTDHTDYTHGIIGRVYRTGVQYKF